jgi:hypothetical protein
LKWVFATHPVELPGLADPKGQNGLKIGFSSEVLKISNFRIQNKPSLKTIVLTFLWECGFRMVPSGFVSKLTLFSQEVLRVQVFI